MKTMKSKCCNYSVSEVTIVGSQDVHFTCDKCGRLDCELVGHVLTGVAPLARDVGDGEN